MLKNEHPLDRYLRLLLGIVLLFAGYFLTSGMSAILIYIVAAIFLVTAATGFCTVYKIFKFTTLKPDAKPLDKKWHIISIAVVVLLSAWAFVAFSSAARSYYLSSLLFVENNYRQTVFFGAHDKLNDMSAKYSTLATGLDSFAKRYGGSRDEQFDTDLNKIKDVVNQAGQEIGKGNLEAANAKLKEAESVFEALIGRQKMPDRLRALVGFRGPLLDLMDAADKEDVSAAEAAYVVADEKLKAVEAAGNDADTVELRRVLDGILTAAQTPDVLEMTSLISELGDKYSRIYSSVK